jgi:hypothetical protein
LQPDDLEVLVRKCTFGQHGWGHEQCKGEQVIERRLSENASRGSRMQDEKRRMTQDADREGFDASITSMAARRVPGVGTAFQLAPIACNLSVPGNGLGPVARLEEGVAKV